MGGNCSYDLTSSEIKFRARQQAPTRFPRIADCQLRAFDGVAAKGTRSVGVRLAVPLWPR